MTTSCLSLSLSLARGSTSVAFGRGARENEAQYEGDMNGQGEGSQ